MLRPSLFLLRCNPCLTAVLQVVTSPSTFEALIVSSVFQAEIVLLAQATIGSSVFRVLFDSTIVMP